MYERAEINFQIVLLSQLGIRVLIVLWLGQGNQYAFNLFLSIFQLKIVLTVYLSLIYSVPLLVLKQGKFRGHKDR